MQNEEDDKICLFENLQKRVISEELMLASLLMKYFRLKQLHYGTNKIWHNGIKRAEKLSKIGGRPLPARTSLRQVLNRFLKSP